MPTPQPTYLFVFGTLRDDDVLRIVLGRELPADCRRVASLTDHRRRKLHDETYPVLTPAPGASVPGQVLALSAQDMERVMFFEADEYALEAAQVRGADGQAIDVVLCAERETRAGPRYPWSLADWQQRYKREFLEHARSYMRLFGTMSAAEAHTVWKQLVGR